MAEQNEQKDKNQRKQLDKKREAAIEEKLSHKNVL